MGRHLPDHRCAHLNRAYDGLVRCRQCGTTDTRVIDSRVIEDGDSIRRRRSCPHCSARFTTFERTEAAPLLVLKRNGDRVPFIAAKVSHGIELAVKGRPVSAAEVVAIVAGIEDAVRANGGPMPTQMVGERVLDALKERDPVAAMRFASVYKHFEDLADFERAATELAEP